MVVVVCVVLVVCLSEWKPGESAGTFVLVRLCGVCRAASNGQVCVCRCCVCAIWIRSDTAG